MKKLVKLILSRFGLELRLIRNLTRAPVGVELFFSQEEICRGYIVKAHIRKQDILFFILDEVDLVQKEHARGKFYEEEELELISRSFDGGVFVDIGANVGNHLLFALKFLGATKVIAFEPNPAAYFMLKCNAALNNVGAQVVHHAVGLSDKPGRATFVTPDHNLGGTRLTPSHDQGAFELTRGDDILRGETIDFIKIDAEGMELQVLAGLAETIAMHRPKIFIEIEDRNTAEFTNFREKNRYTVAGKYIRYRGITNFLLVPNEPHRCRSPARETAA